MGSEVAWSDHHADFAQGVVVRVFPGVPHDPVRTQQPPTFGVVTASLQDLYVVNIGDFKSTHLWAISVQLPCSRLH